MGYFELSYKNVLIVEVFFVHIFFLILIFCFYSHTCQVLIIELLITKL